MKKLFFLLLVVSFNLVNTYSFGFNGGDTLEVGYKYNPLRIGVNAGIGMGSMRSAQGNMHFFNNYFETTGSYALSSRTGLLIGLGYSRFNFSYPSFSAEGSNQTGFSDQYFISAGGYHHVNEKLTLTGMAQFSVPANGLTGSMYNPFGNTRSFDFNAHYKVSDKFSIGAGFRYSEGNFGNGFRNSLMNPMMMNPVIPFGNPYGTPFGNPYR